MLIIATSYLLTACEAPFYGTNCASKCECDKGATSCDPVRGCVCGPGWTGTKCDTDVDECKDLSICKDTDRQCANTIGSYACKCRAGYQDDGNGKCVGK